jgi:hypothetical protein
MKKWEYFEADRKMILEVGMELYKMKDPNKDRFMLALNGMGKIGWELVAVDNDKYYFKRELKGK